MHLQKDLGKRKCCVLKEVILMTFTTRDGRTLRGIRGYKGLSGTNGSICGRPFKFEQGQIYAEDCKPRFKHCGFHFCLHLEDVKEFVPNCSKIVEVFALGEVEGNGSEYATNKIYIGENVWDKHIG